MLANDVMTLSDGLLELLNTGKAPDGVFADDALLDMNVPFWRFQVRGAGTLASMLGQYTDVSTDGVRSEPTSTGFVLEAVARATKGTERVYSRQVFLATVRDGRIAELTMYCTGDWDEETVARQKAEAPMLRP